MSARQNRIRAQRAQKRALKAQTQQPPSQPWQTRLAQQQALLSAEAATPFTLPSGDILPEPGLPFAPLAKLTPTPSHISPAQLAANRANAQLSSGPKSESGRAISSQNHTIHGLTRHNGQFRLLSTEDPAAFTQLKSSLESEHAPQSETEAILVNAMAESHWLAQRAQKLQDTCTCPDSGEITDTHKFSLYLRYQTTHTRAFHKSLNDLLKLRKEKRLAQNGFEAQDRLALKKQHHYWDIARKDAQTCNQFMANVMLERQAAAADSGFEAQYHAELAARGLKKHSQGAAIAA